MRVTGMFGASFSDRPSSLQAMGEYSDKMPICEGGYHAKHMLSELKILYARSLHCATATLQFSESGGSVNGLNLFTELPFL